MKTVRKSLLDALTDYQTMIKSVWFTIASTIDRITGKDHSPIAERFRDEPFSAEDSDWIRWRAGVYVRKRFWENHLAGSEQALSSARSFPNLEHYVEAAKSTVISNNGFDVIRFSDSFLSSCRWTYVNCLLPEPCYQSWTNDHAKDPLNLITSLSGCCHPGSLFGTEGRPGELTRAAGKISGFLLGSSELPWKSCRLSQNGGDGTLDSWRHQFDVLTDLQFAEAKRLAIQNPPTSPIAVEIHDELVSGLIPRFRDAADTMFDRASLKRVEAYLQNSRSQKSDLAPQLASDGEFVAKKGEELALLLDEPELTDEVNDFLGLVRSETTDKTWPKWVTLRKRLIHFSRKKRAKYAIGQWETETQSGTVVERHAKPGAICSETILQTEHPERTKNESKEELFKSALIHHHQYENGSVLNWEPIGSNQLAIAAKIAPSTASSYFKKWFEEYQGYKRACQSQSSLVVTLTQFANESVVRTYGSDPDRHSDLG
ncbi:hypothetical protein [Neorhodopirellula pilleata]|uniref:Uncharacterized protein n=1 Tax=Neorhodopirellula pilleata TaxID=2714738 RepID=A0A5C6AAW5_9BACT|nr:hypothetical protein [Neorhodopirellula pilleata]TWT97182.1 hypothetical protein Pla100_23320 [Neorhodopirellula pilleata]